MRGEKVSPLGVHFAFTLRLSSSGSRASMSVMTMLMSAAETIVFSAIYSQNFWKSMANWSSNRGTRTSSLLRLLCCFDIDTCNDIIDNNWIE